MTLLHFPRNAKEKGDWGAGGRGDARTRRREGAGERSLAAGLRPGRPRELGPQPGLSRPDPTPPECRGIGAGVAASDRRSLSEDHRASPGGRQGEGAVRRRSWLRRRGVPTRPPGHAGLPGSSSAAPPALATGGGVLLTFWPVAVAQTPNPYRSPTPPSAGRRRGVRRQPQWMWGAVSWGSLGHVLQNVRL